MNRIDREALLHWNYYSALESDVVQLARFVELDQSNYNTHSIEIVRIYLAGCSEVDVIAKLLCNTVYPASTARKIDEYRKMLRGPFPEIERTEVTVPRYGLTLLPWSDWEHDQTPRWWSDYQLVKHQRAEYFSRGNLENVLNSVAGLLILTILYYRQTAKELHLRPIPVLFSPASALAYVCPIVGANMALVINDDSR